MKESELHIAIDQVKQGDSKAFEKIYDAYSSALFGVCLKIVNDQEQAEDVMQDAFVKIWKNIQSYESSKGTFFTWMLNIARNTAIDKLRQMKKRGGGSIQNELNDVSNMVANSETFNTNTIGLNELLQKLPEEHQQILEYLYYKGYTQQEVSDELDLPLGTVKTRSRYALRALKDLFILLLLAWTLKHI